MKTPALRIASYNLQKCVGLDLRRMPGRSLAVIADVGAQIVVLQEADKRLPPRPPALPRELVEAHGWQVAGFGAAGSPLAGSLGFHGNAMLLGPEIDLLETAPIDLPGLEPRGAIRAELETPLGRLRVVGVHLGLIRRYRLLQLGAIMRHLQDLPASPTVLAGDFNEWGAARALDHATQGLRLLPDRASYPAPRPVAPLDRFALSPELIAYAHGTHSARPARIASDHLPVWADIRRA
jgi:endonuclease/exonuclease/phosphatase family metal-dependent hydrolase